MEHTRVLLEQTLIIYTALFNFCFFYYAKYYFPIIKIGTLWSSKIIVWFYDLFKNYLELLKAVLKYYHTLLMLELSQLNIDSSWEFIQNIYSNNWLSFQYALLFYVSVICNGTLTTLLWTVQGCVTRLNFILTPDSGRGFVTKILRKFAMVTWTLKYWLFLVLLFNKPLNLYNFLIPWLSPSTKGRGCHARPDNTHNHPT